MKRFPTVFAVCVILLGAMCIGNLWAQNTPANSPATPAAAAEAESTTDISKPDAEGVFPSIVHKGDIVDFLKFLSVACNKNIVPSANVRGQVSVNLFNVTWKETLNAVLNSNGYAYEEEGPFIYVYTAKELSEKKKAARKVEPHVFQLSYISASDAADLIKPLISENGQITTSPEAAKSQGSSETTSGSGENWAGDNYILVVDYPEYIKSIKDLVAKIDRRPAQVLVEATIMVARLTDKNELGIDFNVLGGVDFQSSGGVLHPDTSANVALNGTETTGLTSFTGNVTPGGLSIGIVNSNIGMFIEALETVTDVVTLGNPKVLTLNRQEGKVIVGREDGYITTEVSATTTTQTVEFLETGTQLTFRPFVMEDGYIRMELHPEDSDGGVEVSGQFIIPSKNTTEVTTNVLVKDGRSIVIGGLFRERTDINRSQIPIAGNLPLIGPLFRSTVDDSTKEEVIFIITPHVVKEAADYAVAEDVMAGIDAVNMGAREGLQCWMRQRLANAHYQRARQFQADGRLGLALCEAKLATFLNPPFLDALNLRNELRARRVYEGNYGSMRTLMRELIAKD